MAQPTLAFPGGHGPAQGIGFAAAKARSHHSQLNNLLLEDGHSKGAFEHLAHRRIGVVHRFQALAPAQVGMNHVPLDRSGAHDGDLHDEVVKAGRLQPGKHGELSPRLHLEDP